MTEFEREKEPMHSPGEVSTSKRFSFVRSDIGRVDVITRHPTGRVRTIEYIDAAAPEAEVVRERLLGHGLIMGTDRGVDNAGRRLFLVPSSARPLSYDAASESQGAYSYGDDQLLYDLGSLLSHSSSLGYIYQGVLSKNIAFIEFTQPDERRILFVPGVENDFRRLQEGESPIEEYKNILTIELGDRFSESVRYFEMGYTEGLQIALEG